MEDYNRIVQDTVNELINQGFSDTAFGDIFLEDLKKYREDQLRSVGIHAHFPLWKKDTRLLMEEFIELGFRTIVVCCNGDVLDRSFAGREIDDQFLKDLPKDVDPCGENGEFHTFCFDGPLFDYPIAFQKGEIIRRSYPRPQRNEQEPETIDYWFCDLRTIEEE